MQCFICMFYVMFACSAIPSRERALIKHPVKRSLFSDVIESLRIRAQIAENRNTNEDSKFPYDYEIHGHDTEDYDMDESNFAPRKNDRIEDHHQNRMPKILTVKNETKHDTVTESPKEEIVLFVTTHKEIKSTTRPKRPQKKPRPTANPIKNDKDEEGVNETDLGVKPLTNHMGSLSQIGNRESQIVVKPTVIVNFRGTVSHKDSEIRLEGRKAENDSTVQDIPQNIFNIQQEVKLERNGEKFRMRPKIQKVSIEERNESGTQNTEVSDMMMCDSDSTKTEQTVPTVRGGRSYKNVLEILFSLPGFYSMERR